MGAIATARLDLFGRDAKPLTDPKGDGNWLATGNGVIAIVHSLQILGKNQIPVDLWSQLAALLKAEIASCLDDWHAKRPWFYRRENPFTNQWVLPTVGYLLASAFLGREQYADSYELGVANLRQGNGTALSAFETNVQMRRPRRRRSTTAIKPPVSSSAVEGSGITPKE